jgi:hypothetical protein
MNALMGFLNDLEKNKMYFRLNKVRDSIMVEVAVPGERWEVEFFEDEHIEIEKFTSDGMIYSGSEVPRLFEIFSD